MRGRPYDGRVRTRTRPCLTLHIRLLTGHALQLINSRPRFFSPFTFSNFFSGALLHADGCQEHSELEEEASSAPPPPSAPPATEDFFVAPSATKTCVSPITFSKTRMANAGSGSRCLESVDLPPREYFFALESAGGAGGHYRISSIEAGGSSPASQTCFEARLQGRRESRLATPRLSSPASEILCQICRRTKRPWRLEQTGNACLNLH